MNVDYITKDDTIIFNPEFDKPLKPELLVGYKKIIFSDLILDNNLYDAYEHKKFDNNVW